MTHKHTKIKQSYFNTFVVFVGFLDWGYQNHSDTRIPLSILIWGKPDINGHCAEAPHPETNAANIPYWTSFYLLGWFRKARREGKSRSVTTQISLAVLWKGNFNQIPAPSGKSVETSSCPLRQWEDRTRLLSHTPLALKYFSAHGKGTAILDQRP